MPDKQPLPKRPSHVPLVRIFISSPGDVNNERKIAIDLIRHLPNRPALRERVTFAIVAWDDPDARTPLRATLTPQEALLKNLPSPAECDIVLVVFWSRMGTPFEYEGVRYPSGTYWELKNALEAEWPEVLIYRRTEKKLFNASDEGGIQQYRQVEEFFKSEWFFDAGGNAIRGYNTYATPDEFRQFLERTLEELTLEHLKKLETSTKPAPEQRNDKPPIIKPEPWPDDRSPFQGLKPLTEADSDLFFGRGREIDQLIRCVEQERFIAVVGASASGKSSLVRAGLIPHLKANAISDESTGSKDWVYLTIKPTQKPFDALAFALTDAVRALRKEDAAKFLPSPLALAAALRDDPEYLSKVIDQILQDEPDWVELFLFIDQFEELFSAVTDVAPFALMLLETKRYRRARVVITMRDDFFQRANGDATLSELLRYATFSLAAPSDYALYEMLVKPSEYANLAFEAGLVDTILDETTKQAGGLALMAFLLEELFSLAKKRDPRQMTLADYAALGGVQKAIANRADLRYRSVDAAAQQTLPTLTLALAHIHRDGRVTRRRALKSEFLADTPIGRLVESLEKARLLTASKDSQNNPVIEVAHEALFSHWQLMANIIQDNTAYQVFKLKLSEDAQAWSTYKGRGFLYSRQKLNTIPSKFIHDSLAETSDPTATTFLRRSIRWVQVQKFAIAVLLIFCVAVTGITSYTVAQNLSRKLQAQNLNPLVSFPDSTIAFEGLEAPVHIPAFSIDRYEVSYGQYRLCVAAGECTLPEETFDPNHPILPIFANAPDNFPVRQATARQAASFCHWLGRRLPTTFEWERAARGITSRPWPWVDGAAPTLERVNAPLNGQNAPQSPVSVDDSAYLDGATSAQEGAVMHLVGNMTEWTASTCEPNSYNCRIWDGKSTVDTLVVRGFGWQTSIPSNAHLGLMDQLPTVPSFVPYLDSGFRCASH